MFVIQRAKIGCKIFFSSCAGILIILLLIVGGFVAVGEVLSACGVSTDRIVGKPVQSNGVEGVVNAASLGMIIMGLMILIYLIMGVFLIFRDACTRSINAMRSDSYSEQRDEV
jgi:uncharacterized membrane protein